MIYPLLAGLFLGISIVCAVGWYLERGDKNSLKDYCERLLDRLQSEDLNQFRMMHPIDEDPGPKQPEYKVYASPNGLIRHYEPINAE